MGLDMYLTKRTYVKNWSYYKEEDRFDITINKGGKPFDVIKPERVKYIIEEVAYWRKANAIHAWFVDNVQNGVDECQETYVERGKLVELLEVCEQALNTDNPAAVLPTRGGFFFGSLEYDEYYKQDIEDTVKVLTEILAEPDDGEFYYHSSW